MLTRNHRIKDIYRHPLGRDVIDRLLLQLGRSQHLVDNPLVGAIRLKSLPRLTRGALDEEFIQAVLVLLNSEGDLPKPPEGQSQPIWWKEAVFYQIYPRSFKDSNGDGIGDLAGIREKLDYLQDLGVDALWLCPVYDSPNDDNGYDIRDYTKILAEFGTMADFEGLLDDVHRRGMRLIMDLVVNHTSDEHLWYRQAVSQPDSKYGDYYLFRDEPNNWTSFFSGSAWRYVAERGQYVLHLFSEKQPDLNWENPAVRQDIARMARGWLEKGVDGFRMDVINYISKREGLPDGNVRIGKLIGFTGIEHYFYGPRLHEYLRELKKEAFQPYGAFALGETPGIGLETGRLLSADYRGELDMIFSFDHLENPGRIRFDEYRYDLNYFKNYMIRWMEEYPANCQMSLFIENHDNPRMISKVDSDPRYRKVLAKLLALMELTLRGTPFIYQGQELGLVNQNFSSIRELRDVESLNRYATLRKSMDETTAFARILPGTRDHVRTPMPWSGELYGGFSDAPPWIGQDGDYLSWNAQDQAADPDSVLNFYRKLIALRREHHSLIYGDIRIINKCVQNLFTWLRSQEGETLFIECNLSRKALRRRQRPRHLKRLSSNYPDLPGKTLRPYEAILWRVE